MKRMILVCCLCLAATSVCAEGDWIADKKTGCKIFTDAASASELPDYMIWSGKCKDGKAKGNGTAKFYKNNESSNTYSGLMKDGRCQDNCSWVTRDGLKYSGEVKDGALLPNGTGNMVFPNGSKYSGAFQDGEFDGKGTMLYKSGDKYSGGWSEGKEDGKGTYTFKDGTSYEGLWEHGERIKIF